MASMSDRRGVTILRAYSAAGYLDVEFEIKLNANNDIHLYRLLLRGMNSRLELDGQPLLDGSEYNIRCGLDGILSTAYSLNKWNAAEFISYLYGWNDGYQVAVAKQY